MKVKDGIIGFVVGDALGVPVEFYSRNELKNKPITGMEGYGTYNMPPGTWSDDTSMTIATMTSILNKKNIDYDDLMEEFCEWMFNGKYTQYNDTFDFGVTTSTALNKFKKGTPPLECGGKTERYNGNGSLMRILPLAYFTKYDYKRIEEISSLTHAHERSKISCVLYIEIARSMLKNDLTIEEHIINSTEKIKEYYKDSPELHHFKRIIDNNYIGGILSTGYVINTLESVIYCLENTNNYKDAVLKAVNLGGDTDTIAAICGGLAGIYYGFESIPKNWIEQIPKINEIIKLCEDYDKFCEIFWG